MQIIIPKTDKHDGVFVTDSFLFFALFAIISKLVNAIFNAIEKKKEKKCKHLQDGITYSQDLYWKCAEKDERHTGFYT